ncbi:MAG: hypothetical protein J6O50_03840 [Ruminiclostridium sp.]|nr:hypothetical protein [Ruminiclostridium sp.]
MAKNISAYFDIPDVSLFLEGNTFIGSENTFNFRIKPDGDKLMSSVWYGMKCFELSEMSDEHEEEKSAEGLAALIHHIDGEYGKYMKLVESGEVKGRRTYKPEQKTE